MEQQSVQLDSFGVLPFGSVNLDTLCQKVVSQDAYIESARRRILDLQATVAERDAEIERLTAALGAQKDTQAVVAVAEQITSERANGKPQKAQKAQKGLTHSA